MSRRFPTNHAFAGNDDVADFAALRAAEAAGRQDAAADVRSRIADRHYPLAISMAGRFAKRFDIDPDDALSAAGIALLSSIARFDAGRGFRFSTYATTAIYRLCLRTLRHRGKAVGLDEVPALAAIARDPGPRPDVVVEAADEAAWAVGLLHATLAPTQAAECLAEAAGIAHATLAEGEGVSRAWISARLERHRERLRSAANGRKLAVVLSRTQGPRVPQPKPPAVDEAPPPAAVRGKGAGTHVWSEASTAMPSTCTVCGVTRSRTRAIRTAGGRAYSGLAYRLPDGRELNFSPRCGAGKGGGDAHP